jgi:hypothetical protein
MDEVRIILAIAPLAFLAACGGGSGGNEAAPAAADSSAPTASVRSA